MANARFEKLKKLMDQRHKLIIKFDRSFAIQELWPEAFKTGGVTSWLSGNRSEFYYIIKRKDGQTKRFKVKDVPAVLLEDQFKEDCRSGHYGFKWKQFITQLEA